MLGDEDEEAWVAFCGAYASGGSLDGPLATLTKHNLRPLAEEWCFGWLGKAEARHRLRTELAPAFWTRVGQPSPGRALAKVLAALQTLRDAAAWLADEVTAAEARLAAVAEDPVAAGGAPLRRLQTVLEAELMACQPRSMSSTMRTLYSAAFICSHRLNGEEEEEEEEEEGDEEEEDGGEDKEPMAYAGSQQDYERTLALFTEVNSFLRQLGLLQALAEKEVVVILHKEIEAHILRVCKGDFETEYLGQLQEWLERVALTWLGSVLGWQSVDTDSSAGWRARLSYHVFKTLATLRIGEMFDIIVDFEVPEDEPSAQPASQPAVDDLRECMLRTDQKEELVTSLTRELERRLLHPGATTTQIIDCYISTIKTLRCLDSTGIILDIVSAPVRTYLQAREDTVRCIVTKLIDDPTSDLHSELASGKPLELGIDDDDAEDVDTASRWMPDPLDADPSKVSRNRQVTDITSLLVNIYGSKEIFIDEYRALLAQRLLALTDFTTDKEVRNLELLKLRFGEDHLQACEIMLKDVADSKRINTTINDVSKRKKEQSGETTADDNDEDGLPLRVLILSRLFWPTLREEKLALHERIQSKMDEFRKEFEVLKAARTLDYRAQLGSVKLEIELASRTLELNVSAALATIIMHFEAQDTWTLDALSAKMEMPAEVLKRRLGYWTNLGLIREREAGVYVLDEHGEQGGDDSEDEDGGEASAMPSAEEERESEMQMYWQFVRGMLTSLGSLPLQRVHATLGVFAPDFDRDMSELEAYLQERVRAGDLVCEGGLYKLA